MNKSAPGQGSPVDAEEFALLTAETKFSRVIRHAARVKAWGSFGVRVELKAGQIELIRAFTDEATKPAEP